MDLDVLIVGAGVTGSAIAYQLAKTDLKVGVLEKEEDVSSGTSKANSGIVHAGYDPEPGTLKARLNIKGCEMIPELAKLLEFDYKNVGSLVICFDENDMAELEELKKRGEVNGVKELSILNKEQLHELEPNLSDQAIAALYAPTAGIVCPYGMTIAFAENAADNGVEFIFNEPAVKIEKTDTGWRVNDKYNTRILINAAGVHSDEIHNQICADQIHISPRRGEYYLLDRSEEDLCSHTLFQQPTKNGKGVLISPTVHGNMIVGPNAALSADKEDTSTSSDGLAFVREKAALTIPDVPFKKVIRTFSGMRATPDGGDFIIQESAPNFIDAAGIESPGLTCAPAIGEMVADMVKEKLKPGDNPNYVAKRKGFINISELTPDEWNALIAEDPDYGTVICRCETVTAGQIKDACSRSIPAVSLDGIKRRTRAGMGRCQAGFCSPKSMKILSDISGIPMDEINLAGSGSTILEGKDKEGLKDYGN